MMNDESGINSLDSSFIVHHLSLFLLGEALMKAATIPEQYLDLFQKQAFAQVATLMPDGSPHAAPTWVDYDGMYILVNIHISLQKA